MRDHILAKDDPRIDYLEASLLEGSTLEAERGAILHAFNTYADSLVPWKRVITTPRPKLRSGQKSYLSY